MEVQPKTLIFHIFSSSLSTFSTSSLFAFDAIDQQPENEKSPNEDDVCQTEICHQTASNLLDSMDTTVDPCSNFYTYSCGNFVKHNPVPDNKIEYGKFAIVSEEIALKLQEILTANDEDTSNHTQAVKSAIAIYKSCLNNNGSNDAVLQLTNDAMGGSPMTSGEQWDANNYDFINALYVNLINTNSPLFVIDVGVDEKNTSTNIIYLDQPEMNIDLSYYLEPEDYEHVLLDYKDYIVNSTVALVGNVSDDMYAMAQNIMDLEIQLANISSKVIERQNSTRMYNRMTLAQLQNMTDPDKKIINWTSFVRHLMNASDVTEDEPIIVSEVFYITRLFSILNSTRVDDMANFLAWNFIMFASEDSGGQLQQLHFDFQKVSGGAQKRSEKWVKCVETVSQAWQYAVGQLYIERHTNETDRLDALKMVTLLQKSFIERLNENVFMDNETKSVAIDKVNSMPLLVGYPKWIRNPQLIDKYYADQEQQSGIYLLDLLAMSRTTQRISYSELRVKPDSHDFNVSPMDVNAFYTTTQNSITVPSGIINPPFYQSGAPSATNFGGLGSILGHEVVHGFDNDGRKYDRNGNLEPWWPQHVVEAFEQRSQCFVKQYSRCCPLHQDDDTVHCVDGVQTLGENMADNGGIQAAYQAWKEWGRSRGEDKKLPGMENFSNDQIFFLSFANVWCESQTVESLLAELDNDEHAPVSCRVNGVVSNSPQFATAFNCSKHPTRRRRPRHCTVW